MTRLMQSILALVLLAGLALPVRAEGQAGTFLVVQIAWQAPTDVDLYVYDPSGGLFYWAMHNRDGEDYPGVPDQLSVDATTGPGVEIWQTPEAEAGTYEIELYLWDDSDATPVTGNVVYRGGTLPLPEVTLQPDETLRFQLKVAADGSVELVQ
jgi:uncharacterized protein YfaP (DUF2135 family)